MAHRGGGQRMLSRTDFEAGVLYMGHDGATITGADGDHEW